MNSIHIIGRSWTCQDHDVRYWSIKFLVSKCLWASHVKYVNEISVKWGFTCSADDGLLIINQKQDSWYPANVGLHSMRIMKSWVFSWSARRSCFQEVHHSSSSYGEQKDSPVLYLIHWRNSGIIHAQNWRLRSNY